MQWDALSEEEKQQKIDALMEDDAFMSRANTIIQNEFMDKKLITDDKNDAMSTLEKYGALDGKLSVHYQKIIDDLDQEENSTNQIIDKATNEVNT